MNRILADAFKAYTPKTQTQIITEEVVLGMTQRIPLTDILKLATENDITVEISPLENNAPLKIEVSCFKMVNGIRVYSRALVDLDSLEN